MSAFIEERCERFGVEPICRALEVSASAYYERRTGRRSARAIEDERLLARIREIPERGKAWHTTKADPAAHRRPDLVERDFSPGGPNRLWVADLSLLRCWEGNLFLCACAERAATVTKGPRGAADGARAA